jgi:hypothetical protein
MIELGRRFKEAIEMPRKPKQPKQTHIRVRLDNDLLDRLEKERWAHERTLTGEIVFRLEQSFRQQDLRKIIEDTAEKAVDLALQRRKAPDPMVHHMIEDYGLNRVAEMVVRINAKSAQK